MSSDLIFTTVVDARWRKLGFVKQVNVSMWCDTKDLITDCHGIFNDFTFYAILIYTISFVSFV